MDVTVKLRLIPAQDPGSPQSVGGLVVGERGLDDWGYIMEGEEVWGGCQEVGYVRKLYNFRSEKKAGKERY